MTDNNTNSNSKKLEALCSEVFNVDDVPSADAARAENLSNNLDTSQLQKWASEKLIQAQAKALLLKARNKRIHQNNILGDVKDKASLTVQELRDWVKERLNHLSPSERSQVYCREFEKATEVDLLEMQQDLLALEQLSKNNSNDEL